VAGSAPIRREREPGAIFWAGTGCPDMAGLVDLLAWPHAWCRARGVGPAPQTSAASSARRSPALPLRASRCNILAKKISQACQKSGASIPTEAYEGNRSIVATESVITARHAFVPFSLAIIDLSLSSGSLQDSKQGLISLTPYFPSGFVKDTGSADARGPITPACSASASADYAERHGDCAID
jgi:hypothetical protein